MIVTILPSPVQNANPWGQVSLCWISRVCSFARYTISCLLNGWVRNPKCSPKPRRPQMIDTQSSLGSCCLVSLDQLFFSLFFISTSSSHRLMPDWYIITDIREGGAAEVRSKASQVDRYWLGGRSSSQITGAKWQKEQAELLPEPLDWGLTESKVPFIMPTSFHLGPAGTLVSVMQYRLFLVKNAFFNLKSCVGLKWVIMTH